MTNTNWVIFLNVCIARANDCLTVGNNTTLTKSKPKTSVKGARWYKAMWIPSYYEYVEFIFVINHSANNSFITVGTGCSVYALFVATPVNIMLHKQSIFIILIHIKHMLHSSSGAQRSKKAETLQGWLLQYLYSCVCFFNVRCAAHGMFTWIDGIKVLIMKHCFLSRVLSEGKFFIGVLCSGGDGRGGRRWNFRRGGEAEASSLVVKITAS